MADCRDVRAAAGENREEAVRAAVETLSAGGLLAHPTSTVYGIGGPTSREADEAIAVLKGRPPNRPLVRLVASSADARRLFPQARWTDAAGRLADALWPGPLTLVLDDGTTDGLAVRAEAHELMQAVLRRWGRSMSSTSLNASGAPPATRAPEARRVLCGFPEVSLPILFLESGTLPGPPPSTLVSLKEDRPRMIREGAVSRSQVEGCLREALLP